MNIKNLKEHIIKDNFEDFSNLLNSYSYFQKSEKEIISLLKFAINNNKIKYFNELLNKNLSPEVFWDTNKYLIKNPSKIFIESMVQVFRRNEEKSERKNDYINELLCDFIKYDNLEMVDWLIKKGSSIKSDKENEFTILNYCVLSNAIKCLDYFLSKNVNVNEFDDLVIYSSLTTKKYDCLSLIVNYYPKLKLNNEVQTNFFKYGNKNWTDKLSKNEVKKINSIINPILNDNIYLQNALNLELIRNNMYKDVEINLQKGHSPIGDEKNNLMDLAIMLRENPMRMIKLLLNYGGNLSESNRDKMTKEELEIIDNYPRFSKLYIGLNKNLENKNKSIINKI